MPVPAVVVAAYAWLTAHKVALVSGAAIGGTLGLWAGTEHGKMIQAEAQAYQEFVVQLMSGRVDLITPFACPTNDDLTPHGYVMIRPMIRGGRFVLLVRNFRTGRMGRLLFYLESADNYDEALDLQTRAFNSLIPSPHIIHHFRIIGVDDQRSMQCFIEELCEGDLSMRLDMHPRRVLVEEQARSVVRDILRRVRRLHDLGIVHRGLKLESLLYRTQEASSGPLLGDFLDATRLTADGLPQRAYTGMDAFSAPELLQLPGNGHGAPVDLWSVGVITLQLLIGQEDCRNRFQAYVDHANGPPRYFRGDPPAQQAAVALQETNAHPNNVHVAEPQALEPFEPLSVQADAFISHLLRNQADLRPTALAALQHPWLQAAV